VAAVLASLVLSACGVAGGGPGQCALLTSCGVALPTNLTVFAAASLQPPFDQIGARLLAAKNIKTAFNYAGTQILTSQLLNGAQADVFASADKDHMFTVLNAGLVAAPLKGFATNQLEIAVAKGNPKGVHTLSDLARPGLVVVLADPSVPAGKYADQALRNARVTVKPASLELQVTGVLSKVALGEADAGIVYVSDIVTSGKVDGVAIPPEENVTAVYPIAVLKSAANQAGAQAFVDLVFSAEGQDILKAAGFQGA
jgi:molybdate transport system substrate-binding protein